MIAKCLLEALDGLKTIFNIIEHKAGVANSTDTQTRLILNRNLWPLRPFGLGILEAEAAILETAIIGEGIARVID